MTDPAATRSALLGLLYKGDGLRLEPLSNEIESLLAAHEEAVRGEASERIDELEEVLRKLVEHVALGNSGDPDVRLILLWEAAQDMLVRCLTQRHDPETPALIAARAELRAALRTSPTGEEVPDA